MRIASRNDMLNAESETDEKFMEIGMVRVSMSISTRQSMFSRNVTYLEHSQSFVAPVFAVVEDFMLQQLHYSQCRVAIVLKGRAKVT